MRRFLIVGVAMMLLALAGPAQAGVLPPKITATGCWVFVDSTYRWQGRVVVTKGTNEVLGWAAEYREGAGAWTVLAGGGYPAGQPTATFNLNEQFFPDDEPFPLDINGPRLRFRFRAHDVKVTPLAGEDEFETEGVFCVPTEAGSVPAASTVALAAAGLGLLGGGIYGIRRRARHAPLPA